VIPEVVEVLKKFRTGKEKKFQMPKVCPVQGGGHGGVKAAAIARELILTWNQKRGKS
jgi:NAD-dependent DNA ligase